MSNLPESCPNCGDRDIVVTDEWINQDENYETVWILQAGNVNVRITFCPHCGFQLPTGLLLEALNG